MGSSGSEVWSSLEVSNHASAFKGRGFGFGAGRQPELLPHPLRHRQGGRCRLFPPLPIPQQEPRLFWTPGASSSAGWAGAVGASSYGVISGIWGLAGAWIQVFPAGPGCQSRFPPRYPSPWAKASRDPTTSQEHTPGILGVSQPFVPSVRGAAALSGKTLLLISKELSMIPRVLTLAETLSIPSPGCRQDPMPPAPRRSLPAHPFGRNWDAGGSGCHQPVPMAGIRSKSSDAWDRGVLSLPAFPRSWVGIQAPVTIVVTPGPGAAAVSGNLTDSGSAQVFWGRWHRRVPAPGSASSIRLSLYISLPPLPAPRATVCGPAAAGITLLFPSAPAACQHKATGLGIAADPCNRSAGIAALSKIWEGERSPALV